MVEGEQLALPVKAGQQRFKGTALIGGKGAFVQPPHAGKVRVSPAAVSYTHLDVYKRQGLQDVDVRL